MQNKIFRFGPIALTTTLTTNLLNPAAATGGVNGGSSAQYLLIRHMRIVNKTGSNVAFSIYLGATAGNVAGTELWFSKSVVANDHYDFYGMIRLDTGDFLVGGASVATSLTLSGFGEVGVAG